MQCAQYFLIVPPDLISYPLPPALAPVADLCRLSQRALSPFSFWSSSAIGKHGEGVRERKEREVMVLISLVASLWCCHCPAA